jgi:hypothetical protein
MLSLYSRFIFFLYILSCFILAYYDEDKSSSREMDLWAHNSSIKKARPYRGGLEGEIGIRMVDVIRE